MQLHYFVIISSIFTFSTTRHYKIICGRVKRALNSRSQALFATR